MSDLSLRLFNGSKTKEAWNIESPEFIDDWKPEEVIIDCDFVQVTYRQSVTAYHKDGRMIVDLHWDDDLVVHNGVFYGDFSVYPKE